MTSYQRPTQIGGSGTCYWYARFSNTQLIQIATAFNHNQSSNAEAEYDRLRDLARSEHSKMSSCFDRVRFEAVRALATR